MSIVEALKFSLGHSGSLKMAPFGRSLQDLLLVCHCSCSSVAVELFNVENIVNLKSQLQVIRVDNGTIRKLGYGFLFAFRSNYGCIFSRFDAIHERDRHPDRHRRTARAALCSRARCSHVAKIKTRAKHRRRRAKGNVDWLRGATVERRSRDRRTFAVLRSTCG